MVVHPSCIHLVQELRAYRWETAPDGSVLPRPADRDNHLMDALRYAMEDVSVHPAGKTSVRRGYGGIRAEDFRGAWGG